MRARLPRLSDHHRPTRTPHRRRHLGRGPVPAESGVSAPAAPIPPPDPRERLGLTPERRAREGGGPEDRAHYACDCGYGFQARVSTSVACPHCGGTQAW